MKQFENKDRQAILLYCAERLMDGRLSQGEVLKALRKELLNMNQSQYAEFVGVSRKTISDIERGVGGQNTQVLNAVFKPLGFRLGLVPRAPHILPQVFRDTPTVLK